MCLYATYPSLLSSISENLLLCWSIMMCPIPGLISITIALSFSSSSVDLPWILTSKLLKNYCLILVHNSLEVSSCFLELLFLVLKLFWESFLSLFQNLNVQFLSISRLFCRNFVPFLLVKWFHTLLVVQWTFFFRSEVFHLLDIFVFLKRFRTWRQLAPVNTNRLLSSIIWWRRRVLSLEEKVRHGCCLKM